MKKIVTNEEIIKTHENLQKLIDEEKNLVKKISNLEKKRQLNNQKIDLAKRVSEVYKGVPLYFPFFGAARIWHSGSNINYLNSKFNRTATIWPCRVKENDRRYGKWGFGFGRMHCSYAEQESLWGYDTEENCKLYAREWVAFGKNPEEVRSENGIS